MLRLANARIGVSGIRNLAIVVQRVLHDFHAIILNRIFFSLIRNNIAIVLPLNEADSELEIHVSHASVHFPLGTRSGTLSREAIKNSTYKTAIAHSRLLNFIFIYLFFRFYRKIKILVVSIIINYRNNNNVNSLELYEVNYYVIS